MLSIENVRKGGLIQLPPHGPDMQEIDMQVTARHVYEQGGFRWYELEGESGNGTVWLDVERDDELETSVTIRRLRLTELGLGAEDTHHLEIGSSVEVEGRVFHLEERGRARFLPGGDAARAETLEFWDFESEDEQYAVGMERWGGSEIRAYLTQSISPSRIRIYRLSDATL